MPAEAATIDDARTQRIHSALGRYRVIAYTVGVGLLYARRALRAPMPFANFTQLLQKDLEFIERTEL